MTEPEHNDNKLALPTNKHTSTLSPSTSSKKSNAAKFKLKRRASALFHGTKKWGSFSKSTIKRSNKLRKYGSTSSCLNYTCLKIECLPIFHPVGPLKCCWDAIVMIMLIYTSVEIPYTLAFGIDLKLGTIFGVIALLIDICLMIDILFSFRTAFFDKFDNLRLITNPVIISKKYLKGWFFIDLITSFPFEFISPGNETELDELSTYVKILRVFRLLRVIKILRLLKMVKLFDGFLKRIVVREILVSLKLVKIISFMLLYAHLSACCWYFVGCSSTLRYGVSWITEDTTMIIPHECVSPNLIDVDTTIEQTPIFERYSYSWYWSVVTLFTTGYGDIVAHNIEEQWITSISILIGTCFFAYFIGTLTSLISEGDAVSSSKLQKMEAAQHFCDQKKLPREMARAVLTHTRYHCNYNLHFDENDILANLPPYLQMEVGFQVSKNLLSNLDFLQMLDPFVKGCIALKMRSISCNKGYKLFCAGDIAQEIYIQRTGSSLHTSEFQMKNKKTKSKKTYLKRGCVCGEYAIIQKKRRSTVTCQTWCEFYVMEINDIIDVLQRHYGNKWEKKWFKMKKLLKTEYDKAKLSNKHKPRRISLKKNPIPTNDVSPSHHQQLHVEWGSEANKHSIRSTISTENNDLSPFARIYPYSPGDLSEGIEYIEDYEDDQLQFTDNVRVPNDDMIQMDYYNTVLDTAHSNISSIILTEYDPTERLKMKKKRLQAQKQLKSIDSNDNDSVHSMQQDIDLLDNIKSDHTIHINDNKLDKEPTIRAKSMDDKQLNLPKEPPTSTMAKATSLTADPKNNLKASKPSWRLKFRRHSDKTGKKVKTEGTKSPKKKKTKKKTSAASNWFGSARQNSELRDQALVKDIIEQDDFFSDTDIDEYDDQVDLDVFQNKRALSEDHIKKHNKQQKFDFPANYSSPNMKTPPFLNQKSKSFTHRDIPHAHIASMVNSSSHNVFKSRLYMQHRLNKKKMNDIKQNGSNDDDDNDNDNDNDHDDIHDKYINEPHPLSIDSEITRTASNTIQIKPMMYSDYSTPTGLSNQHSDDFQSDADVDADADADISGSSNTESLNGNYSDSSANTDDLQLKNDKTSSINPRRKIGGSSSVAAKTKMKGKFGKRKIKHKKQKSNKFNTKIVSSISNENNNIKNRINIDHDNNDNDNDNGIVIVSDNDNDNDNDEKTYAIEMINQSFIIDKNKQTTVPTVPRKITANNEEESIDVGQRYLPISPLSSPSLMEMKSTKL